MKRLALSAILSLLMILLISCSPIEQKCEKPFILQDGACCLDLDEDGKCDAEKETGTETKDDTEIVVEEKKEIEIDHKKEDTQKASPITGASILDIKEEQEPSQEDIKEFESASIDASDLLSQLMKTYSEKTDSYKYYYRGDWYLVRENSIKVMLGKARQYTSQYINGTYYPLYLADTAYINKINKTVTGYCEGNDPLLGKRRCAELDIIDVPIPLIYSDFYTKRPDEWLFEVYTLDPEVKTETGYYYLGPRKVQRLEYNDGTKQVIMFYDEKIGLPIKVQTFVNEQPSEIWLYDQLSSNTVLDKHVKYRTADEISNKEAFYSTSH